VAKETPPAGVQNALTAHTTRELVIEPPEADSVEVMATPFMKSARHRFPMNRSLSLSGVNLGFRSTCTKTYTPCACCARAYHVSFCIRAEIPVSELERMMQTR